MTLNEWLLRYNITWHRKPRGFEIVNGLGEARFVQVITSPRVTRYISEVDVHAWIKNNLKDSLFPAEAQHTWKFVVKP